MARPCSAERVSESEVVSASGFMHPPSASAKATRASMAVLRPVCPVPM
ncbi:hypothetical protein ACFFX0_12085 [Citricoccus parietis]|uniref:Uncharacterized protein n=1 Tax=Citricoccus parietis TaxID=592307 RepID=A0ABV5FZ00_9MICC